MKSFLYIVGVHRLFSLCRSKDWVMFRVGWVGCIRGFKLNFVSQ